MTPKGETQLTPEEKLLRAIFGEKASDVKDTSLRVPSGMNGTIINVQVFTRDGVEKDARARQIEESELEKVRKDLDDQYRILADDTYLRLERLLVGQIVDGGPGDLRAGSPVTEDYLRNIDRQSWFEIRLRSDDGNDQLEKAREQLEAQKALLDAHFRREGRQAQVGRRSCARRTEDGQGISRREAPSSTRRQDGGPAWQQGRDLDDRPRLKTCRT